MLYLHSRYNYLPMEYEKSEIAYLLETKKNLENLLNSPDELPEEFTVGNSKYKDHKFRGNWFMDVYGSVYDVGDIMRQETLLQEANVLREKIANKKPTERTTREMIEEADALIQKALLLLESVT